MKGVLLVVVTLLDAAWGQLTCGSGSFSCPFSGFSLKADPSTIECPTTGCDEATCCLAMCDNTGFTGCQQAGYTNAPNQASTACGDNTIASCTTDLCCLSTTCSNVVCPAGTTPISPVPNCPERDCCKGTTDARVRL
eukprot:TRINITY_DN1889_c0_g2_i3.p1 TRINITY_DN1889_c0_g2~~TRINITY_DN1889_c0_g2_i3.p1  ORF type:complete len:137 (+),score=27.29 TRINITY_DN1889_c0_g2_i3:159-569(+)